MFCTRWTNTIGHYLYASGRTSFDKIKNSFLFSELLLYGTFCSSSRKCTYFHQLPMHLAEYFPKRCFSSQKSSIFLFCLSSITVTVSINKNNIYNFFICESSRINLINENNAQLQHSFRTKRLHRSF